LTKQLYFDDSYLKEFDASVVSVNENAIELDQSAFYPTGGGQLCDTGKLVKDGKEFAVTEVRKQDGKVVHIVSEQGLQQGDKVKGVIDWERRYKLMRMHTAAHVLSATVNKITGALVGGKQLKLDQSRIDFTLEQFDSEKIQQFGEEARKTTEKGALVKTSFMKREEALKLPGMIRLASRLPPEIPELRIVEIEGVDIQACGGTHVKNIKEIGQIKVIKTENKGKGHRRMYYSIE